ncbi:cyclophilin-like fold protein [uncultured Alistipes sp.]|jgi:hypothetical protein|uniref:cyclophilin-like fold protein n=1 Tax=uncultured Alistipes sp. TaxID=538949 RepID=UPI0025F0A8D2|nr:cyclophilin-like fold protein [uncultured Alistipes sp.]
MKKLLMILLSLMVATGVSACSPDDSIPVSEQPGGNENPGGDDNPGTDPDNPEPENMKMVIKIGSTTFTATLADNNTAKAFKALLPMTVNMTEHAGNEKYYDLPNVLPAAASNHGTIRNGDIMLYGSRTLVLFYKTFSTSYSYTRIGSVDDPAGLESALGTGSITVTFEIKD